MEVVFSASDAADAAVVAVVGLQGGQDGWVRGRVEWDSCEAEDRAGGQPANAGDAGVVAVVGLQLMPGGWVSGGVGNVNWRGWADGQTVATLGGATGGTHDMQPKTPSESSGG